jgi:hypothetical protein
MNGMDWKGNGMDWKGIGGYSLCSFSRLHVTSHPEGFAFITRFSYCFILSPSFLFLVRPDIQCHTRGFTLLGAFRKIAKSGC